MQRHYHVYNDGTGDYVYVGMDADALDLVELRYVENEKALSCITMDPARAVKVRNALDEYLRLEHGQLYTKLATNGSGA